MSFALRAILNELINGAVQAKLARIKANLKKRGYDVTAMLKVSPNVSQDPGEFLKAVLESIRDAF